MPINVLSTRQKLNHTCSAKSESLFLLVNMHTSIYLDYTSIIKQKVFMCAFVGLWSVSQLKGKEIMLMLSDVQSHDVTASPQE